MFVSYISALLLLLNGAHGAMPFGCSSTDTDGQYYCDFRVISLPISANQFTSQPQHIMLAGVSGSIPDNSFVDLGESSAVFPFPSDVKRIDIICLKGEGVVLSANTFNGLDWLDVLTFTDCKITTLPASIFQPIGTLDVLEFNYGSLDDVYPTSLEGLSVQSSGLRGSEGRLSFKYTSFLGGRIPSNFLSSAAEAKEVEFIGGGISNLDFDTFAGMSSLGSLDLSWNNFTYLPLDLFEGLTSLGTFTVDGISWDCSACGATWFVEWAYDNYVELNGDIVCASPPETKNQRMLSYFVNSCSGKLYSSAGASNGQVGIAVGTHFISIQDILALVFILGLSALCIVNTVKIAKMENGSGSSSKSKSKDSKSKSKDSKSKDSKKKDSKKKHSKSSKSKSTGNPVARKGSGKVTPSDVKINTWT